MKPLDFMIVGAQKSGTTALSHFLAEHPEIEIAANKEAHLFDDRNFNEDWSVDEVNVHYELLFSRSGDVVRGEATPIYMYLPEITGRLGRYNPDLKLIVLLRDPVERAYSHYRMETSRGNERFPFWLALLLEPFRLFWDRRSLLDQSSLRRHSYRNRGYYARQIRNLMAEFPRDQILILSMDDLRDRHQKTMKLVFDFLGVEPIETMPREVFSQPAPITTIPISAFFLRQAYRRDLRELADLVDFSVEHWWG